MAAMRFLLPHVRAAFETTVRLRRADRKATALMDALDWLADGALLLRADGNIAYANQAMQDIARESDGIHIVQNRVAFKNADARARFDPALGDIARLRTGGMASLDAPDFAVARASGGPRYLVSLRPLPRSARSARRQSQHRLYPSASHQGQDRL
jgi:PAS domain-containing protein